MGPGRDRLVIDAGIWTQASPVTSRGASNSVTHDIGHETFETGRDML